MLDKLTKTKQAKRKRIGRGYASGKGGHTVGRGQKGQKSRSGYSKPRPDFEGGAMPLSRRLPKLRGFSQSKFQKSRRYVISLDDLNTLEDGTVVNVKLLREKGLIGAVSQPVDIKILANGKLQKALTIEGVAISEAAKEAVIKAKGKIK